MKIVSALLIGSAMADKWAKIGSLWSGLQQSDSLAEDDRKIIELFTISSVANYGCWCRFNTYKPHKGTPQDTVDEACKQWYQNYDCMHFDYSDDTSRCDLNVDYNDTIVSLDQPFSMTTDYVAECDAANPNDVCASTACAVDAVFIREVFLFLADNTLNMTLSGWYGFDGARICHGLGLRMDGTTEAPDNSLTTAAPEVATTLAAGTTLAPAPTMDCCGQYPNRFPYKLKDGNRACCEDANTGLGTTYDVNVLACCPNSSPITQLIGSCTP